MTKEDEIKFIQGLREVIEGDYYNAQEESDAIFKYLGTLTSALTKQLEEKDKLLLETSESLGFYMEQSKEFCTKSTQLESQLSESKALVEKYNKLYLNVNMDNDNMNVAFINKSKLIDSLQSQINTLTEERDKQNAEINVRDIAMEKYRMIITEKSKQLTSLELAHKQEREKILDIISTRQAIIISQPNGTAREEMIEKLLINLFSQQEKTNQQLKTKQLLSPQAKEETCMKETPFLCRHNACQLHNKCKEEGEGG